MTITRSKKAKQRQAQSASLQPQAQNLMRDSRHRQSHRRQLRRAEQRWKSSTTARLTPSHSTRTAEVRYGATATKPADPTKTATTTTEYTFADWYSDSGLTTPFSFDTAIKEDITLYAKWTETAVTPQKTAGSISYATASVSKTTTDDAAFTNELTKTGDGTVTYASDNTAVATVNASTGEVTIMGAGTAIITATVTDSTSYTYATKTASYTLTITQAVTYIGTKAPTEAKSVGDIVFNDGSATPYSEDLTLTDDEKNAAIAVIFYVGTDCSNDSTSRTLGVGLAQNQSGPAWCLSSANACEVNITTIQESDKDGSDNLSQIGEFLDENDELNDDTGTADKYPAFYFAKNYASQTGSNVSGTDYEDGWYLPAKAELQKIYESLSTVNKELAACGGTEFNQYH